MDRAIAELARRQHGVVALAHLTALGLSPAAVRMRTAAGRPYRIHRGVYAVGHRRLTRRGARMAAALAAGPGAVLSHRDAAALWDLSPFSSGSIHVTVSSRGGRSHRNGLVVHRSRLHPEDREEVDEVPVTAVPRTLLDLAEIERDRARDARLKRAGYEVVRFTYRQLVAEPELVLATVRELLSRRGGAFAHRP